MVALAWLLASHSAPSQNYQLVVSDGDALAIVRAHCSGCHAKGPSVAHFSTAPAGIILESLADLRRQRTQVLAQAVSTRVMPLGNPTAMTLEDRARLGTWIRQQSN